MAVRVDGITYPVKCHECGYSPNKPDENLRTGSTCNISIKELCPRTKDGAEHHKRLIMQGKRFSECMVNKYATVVEV